MKGPRLLLFFLAGRPARCRGGTCYWSNRTEAPNCPGFNGTCLAVAEAVSTAEEARHDARVYCGGRRGEAYTVWLDEEPIRQWRFTCCTPPGGSEVGTVRGGAGRAASARGETDRDHQRELQSLPNQACYFSDGAQNPNCSGWRTACPNPASHGCGGASTRDACDRAISACDAVDSEAFTVWLDESHPECPWRYSCCFEVDARD
jgi:hypothetical protein